MKKKSKKKAIIITAVVLSFVILTVGCTASAFMSAQSEMAVSVGRGVDAFKIERQDLSNYVSVSGSVEGINVVNVTTELSAKVKTLNKNVGDVVKEGDVLCVFDSSELQSQYDLLKEKITLNDKMTESNHNINQRALENAQAEKELALSQAQRAISEAETARDNAYSKYNELLDKYNQVCTERDTLATSLTEENYAQYEMAVQSAETIYAELETLESQLSSFDSAVQTANDSYTSTERAMNSAIQGAQDAINAEEYTVDNSLQQELDKLAKQIENCTVKADKGGIITAVNVAEGSIPLKETIMVIEDTSSFKINVSIKEADILKLKEGMKAIITTAATGDEEIIGEVSRVVNIFSGADAMTGETGGYSAEITVDATNNNLLIGMNAKVKIILEEVTDVLTVPYDSIITDEDGNDFIYIAQESSDGAFTAKEVKIEKLLESNYFTAVSSSEIQEGDKVIANPEKISDGKEITIRNNTSLEDGE